MTNVIASKDVNMIEKSAAAAPSVAPTPIADDMYCSCTCTWLKPWYLCCGTKTPPPLQPQPVVETAPTTEGFTSDPTKSLRNEDLAMISSLNKRKEMFVVADPALPDCPLIYVSPLFCRISGYSAPEIMGRNCRFLQGPRTDRKHVDIIRSTIETKKDSSVALLNYRRDGTCFYNQFFMSALTSTAGETAYFIGVQQEVRSMEGGQDTRNFGYRFRRACKYLDMTVEQPDGSTIFKPKKQICQDDVNFLKRLQGTHSKLLISDPDEQDNPIVYVSHMFLTTIGYGWDNIVGANCRFLQGAKTDPDEVEKIRNGIEHEEDTQVMLVNYLEDGSMFNNDLYLTMIRDNNGKVVYHCGVSQIGLFEEVPDPKLNPGRKLRSKD